MLALGATMGPFVGLVVNPSASRDIRRLTSLARTVDVYERVIHVARILQGLSACAQLVPGGLGPVRYMPEACQVVQRAHAEIAHAGLDAPAPDPRPGAAADGVAATHRRLVVEPVLPPGSGTADDADGTARAAAALARAGARCVVTVGGDGTNRAVARGWPEAVLCAVPGGTNNAFAPPLDPVTAGLAAGFFAIDPEGAAGHARACPRLDVRAGPAAETFALVDVAVVRGAWVGAHAVWDPETLVEVVVTRADPTVSGLAGLAGMVRPLAANTTGGPPRAVHLRLGAAGSGAADNDTAPGGPMGDDALSLPRTVLAPLGPGHLVPVVVRSWRALGAGEAVRLGPYPERVTLAFDGERETVVEPGTPIEVRLARSPLRLLDAAGLLRSLSKQGALLTPPERRGRPVG
jgi:hypothetical protein